MMMPVLDQSPAHHHHHHGHGHQAFYHQQQQQQATLPEQTGKMQLTLILPNGVPSFISVDANTPMMDLLVQATSSNKLNPSGYSLVVLDSNQHVIHFKPNQTVGQIVQNCQLPQTNGSSTISLLPKEASNSVPSSKSKAQPFEITVRLQVNLPDAQKILLRIDPTLPLYEIKEQICKQKKYIDSNRYTLRLPHKPDQALLLGLSLAEYKTNALTLVHVKQDPKISTNQLQSFDRLYRTRSESQPHQESIPEVADEHGELTNAKQRPASVQLNPDRSPIQGQNVTSLPGRSTHPPITSHTSLHAYWNDPNFDTQSQVSNSSSTGRKRRAPRPPGQLSPNTTDQTITQLPAADHHQSHESLTESTNGSKQKRKAPVLPIANVIQENAIVSDVNLPSSTTTTIEHVDVHTTVEHIDDHASKMSSEPPKIDVTMDPVDQQRLVNLLADQPTPPQARLVITTTYSPPPEQINRQSQSSTPIYSQIQKTQEPVQPESPYSTVKSTPTPPPVLAQHEEQIEVQPTPYCVKEIVQAGIAEPPAPPVVSVKPMKSSKKSPSTDGLLKIVNDHNERAKVYQADDKQAENVSYFRVAKSRHGKFETDNRGFVNNATGIFDATQNVDKQQPPISASKSSEIVSRAIQSSKSAPITAQTQSKGKQAYDLLKKYEKEDEEEQPSLTIDTDYLKTQTPSTVAENDKSPTPIQLEVTERTTHISVTVESDRRQMITRTSPAPEPITSNTSASGPPPVLAPKPFGKTITEYRTVRRIGNGGETTTTTTVRTETVPPTESKRAPSAASDDQTRSTSAVPPHESLMESIRQFGGSQHLSKQ